MFSETDAIEFVKTTEEFKRRNRDEQCVKRMECTLYHFMGNSLIEIDYINEYFDLEDFHLKNETHLSSEFDYFEVVLHDKELRLYTEEDDDKEWCWIVSIPNLA